MIGLGTIANTAAVLVGGLLGLLLKNGISKRFENILMQALGLSTLFIGVSGVLKYMLYIKEETISTQGTMLLIICVGAMAIVGSMQDGLTGDCSMLIAKSMLDFVIVLIFAAAYGIGTLFSAIPIFIYQGSITVISALFGSIISETLIGELSFVGNALIFCVGVNLIREKTFRVANMLPALLIPMILEIWRTL